MATQADWTAGWQREPLDFRAPDVQERSRRWREQERLLRSRFGTIEGLRVIELGAGRGLNGLLFARRGADVTLLDTSPVVLEQAARLFEADGLSFTAAEADIFELPAQLRGAFDVSMSYGLCEHFVGERRHAVVAAHLTVLRPGALALLGVPNRYAPAYRLWMKTLKLTGSWPLGTEVPFSAEELRRLAVRVGGDPLPAIYGSFVSSLVDHGVNQLLFKLGAKRVLPVPQGRVPILDRFAYELVLPVVKPA